MKNPDEHSLPHPLEPDDSPGVPGFRTWRGVYLLVFAAFVLVVIGLAILSRVFA
jgi:hypothetical protein